MDPTTFATAYGLTASVGLRPFLTLALAAVAIHLGYLHASPAFARIGNDGAAFVFAGLAILEFFGDKIPAVDHALHAVHFAIKPIVAALLVGGTIGGSSAPPEALDLVAMAAAAAGALGIHAGVSALRGASSATTLGLANPFVSLAEDATAIGAALLAILIPYAGAALAALVGLAAFAVLRLVYLEFRKTRRAGTLA